MPNMSALNQIFIKLGINNSKNLLSTKNKKWKDIIPYRLQKGLEEIGPDAFFVQENKPIVFFFDFTKKKPNDEKNLFNKIWNLGGVPVIIFIKDGDIEIYNGFSFDTKSSALEALEKGGKRVFNDDISIWDIFSGKTWDNLPKPKNQVDEKLLKNLQDTKTTLEQRGLKSDYAQNIIGRLLFSRYLIDRGVIIDKKYFNDEKSFLQILKNKKKNLLYKYFGYLKETFNGDLFPVGKTEQNDVGNAHLEILHSLFNGDDIISGQQSLFNLYNFKIIPVELISEVYERFMGAEKQRKEGAYYTPAFLVDYILEKTVKKHLKKNNSCKVFDPSCGSGIFLVETLRCLIEKNIKQKKLSHGELNSKLKKIIEKNIFGVDRNEIAINLTVFSLGLTLLDYIEPKDVTKFKLPKLIGKNLFIADFFDLEKDFNKEIKGLDFILGNPPWGSDKEKDSLHIQYIKNKKLPVSDKQLAQSFSLRVKDFSSKKTKCALVLHSKVLYNHKAYKFREYWLKSFKITEVLELSPARKDIFANAVAPTAIVFFQYTHKKETKDGVIRHTSIKPNIFLKYLKILVIEKNDIKEIKQEYFQKYDWLWKVMLYGNVFDFYFIKRLKENYKNLQYFIDKENVVFGAGFKRGNKKNKFKYLSDKYLLKPKYLDHYKCPSLNFKIVSEYPDLLFEDDGVKNIYNPPHILLKRALKDKPILTYSEHELVFPNTVFGIHGTNKKLLKTIGSYFSSFLVRYLLFLTSTTWGVEREEVLQKEYKNLPFVLDKNIENNLSKIFNDLLSIANKKNNRQILDNKNYDELIENKIKKINLFLVDKFGLSKQDKNLVDYSINISTPLFSRRKEPITECTSRQLEDYVKIFADYFGTRWNKKPNFFEIDIYYNNYIVAVNFKVVKKKRDRVIKIINNLEKNFFELIKLGEERITDKFFQQRDIKGFNKTSFYVVKSNQFKNWHPAVAQADLHEFIEAMMQSEIESFKS